MAKVNEHILNYMSIEELMQFCEDIKVSLVIEDGKITRAFVE